MINDISNDEIEKRIVRYGELKPCKTAFIDAHTPGPDQKENFTIIGGGVIGGTGIVILAIVLDRITQKIIPQDTIKTR